MLDYGWVRHPGGMMKNMDPDWKHSLRRSQQSVRRGVTATYNVTMTALEAWCAAADAGNSRLV